MTITNKMPETVYDFKMRMALLLRDPKAPLTFAKSRNACTVRGPNDRGYFPPKRKAAK